MNEILKKELINKGIILTYEQWWEQVRTAFECVHNSLDPKILYEEYANEIVKDYKEILKYIIDKDNK